MRRCRNEKVSNYRSKRSWKGCIITTCSSVDHDCEVGNYVHIAVDSHLCGDVSVGSGTWNGAGATVSNNVSVCLDCMIGAGAVVVNDIQESGTYVGVPVRRIDMEEKSVKKCGGEKGFYPNNRTENVALHNCAA